MLSFDDLRQGVRAELADPGGAAGTPFPSFPSLTAALKGFRPGELTVLTGPTGAGKTTLLSQLSLDFAMQVAWLAGGSACR